MLSRPPVHHTKLTDENIVAVLALYNLDNHHDDIEISGEDHAKICKDWVGRIPSLGVLYALSSSASFCPCHFQALERFVSTIVS